MKLSTFLLTALLVSISVGALAAENDTEQEATESIFEQEFVLENIYCTGNTKTKCSLIKKELRVRPGKKVRDKDLQNSKIRLQLLGLFENVDLNLKKGSERGKVDLEVSVKEGSSIYTVTGLGLGKTTTPNPNYDGIQSDLQFTIGTRNLFGTGKRLSATVFANNEGGFGDQPGVGSYSLRYSDPNLFGSRRFFLNLDYSYDLSRYKTGFYHDGFANPRSIYLDEREVLNSEVGLRVGNFSYFTLGYALIKSQYYPSSYSRNPGEPLPNLEREQSTNQFMVFGYGLNTKDDLYFPTSGTRLDLKLAMLTNGANDFGGFGLGLDAPAEIAWNTTWTLKPKWYLSTFLEMRAAQLNDELANNGLGFDIAYQPIKGRSYKDLTDLRFYFSPSIGAINDFNQYGSQLAAGVSLRSKKYGVVRFQLFGRQ